MQGETFGMMSPSDDNISVWLPWFCLLVIFNILIFVTSTKFYSFPIYFESSAQITQHKMKIKSIILQFQTKVNQHISIAIPWWIRWSKCFTVKNMRLHLIVIWIIIWLLVKLPLDDTGWYLIVWSSFNCYLMLIELERGL